MNKIAIIGPPGAGKTTLARQLGDILDIEVIHLDRYFWHEGWEKAKSMSTSKWEKQQHTFMSKDSWIIDGSYHDSLTIRMEAADAVVFLDMKPPLCTARIIKRHFSKTPRLDLPKECPDRLDLQFIGKVWSFPFRERRVINQTIQKQSVKEKVVALSTRRAVANYLRNVREGRSGVAQLSLNNAQKSSKGARITSAFSRRELKIAGTAIALGMIPLIYLITTVLR